jgi:16S rRNA (guanine966-N2)-methyltransferase
MPRPDRPRGRPHAKSSTAPKSAAASGDEAASAPRIIGGELRGRRLEFVPHARTRPMKDRVRESLFDLLGTSIRGAIALDLFAGTGALGFEAVSRGAARAIFAEQHFPTADAVRKSARALGIADRVDVRGGDVLLWTKRMPELPTTVHWVVFISPPWDFFHAGHARRAELLALIDSMRRAAPPGSTLVVEADTAFDPASLAEPAAWEPRPIPPAVLYFLVGNGT